MIQPTLSVLYHDKLSNEFLMKCIELVATGIGMPAFFNDTVSIERLLAHGASLEDARNGCIIGCVEGGFSHACNMMHDGGFNMPKMLELALNNGLDPLTGRQLGPTTGDATTFQSYDKLHEAVLQQFQYFTKLRMDYHLAGQALEAQLFPAPFISALTDDCIKKGQDMSE